MMIRHVRTSIFIALTALGVLAVPCLVHAQTPPPHIFFTDLTSGPNTGGENNNGTILTIYGNFFGINGAGCGSTTTVTVGGGAVAAYIGQCPTQWLWYQKISVAIGPNAATGNVVVRVNGVDSNGVPFTVRSGNIRCISPTGNDANSGNFGACWRNATKV